MSRALQFRQSQKKSDPRTAISGPEHCLWLGKQWRVTVEGIECVDPGPDVYDIPRDALLEQPTWWLEHMGEKRWVDMVEFAQAWEFALFAFGSQR